MALSVFALASVYLTGELTTRCCLEDWWRFKLMGAPATKAQKRGPAPKFQKQMERIAQLPRARQQVVMDMLDGVLAQRAVSAPAFSPCKAAMAAVKNNARDSGRWGWASLFLIELTAEINSGLGPLATFLIYDWPQTWLQKQ